MNTDASLKQLNFLKHGLKKKYNMLKNNRAKIYLVASFLIHPCQGLQEYLFKIVISIQEFKYSACLNLQYNFRFNLPFPFLEIWSGTFNLVSYHSK